MKELRVVSDGTFGLDGGSMFGVVPRTVWARMVKPDEENRVPCGMNCLLLEVAHGYALIEAGLGEVFPDEKRYALEVWPGPRLPEALAAANVDAGEVRWVILSHLHYDHAGWIASPDPGRKAEGGCVPTFPNARHVVQEGELGAAATPPLRMRASYLPNQWKTVADAGLWRPARGDGEVFDGVRVEVTGGHTLDHQAIMIERGDVKVVFLGDLVPTWLHLRPAWCMGYDSRPDDVAEAKAAWVERIMSEGWTAAAYHEPGPALVRLSRDEHGGLRVEPVANH